MHIFCGADFLDRLNFPPSPNLTVYTVDGSFVQAGKAAQEYAARRRLPFESGFFNPARREGLKLAYLEAVDQMPVEPAVVIQAVSSGMGLYGAFKGFREYLALGRLSHMPRIVCAQQATCAPMYNGWRKKVARLDSSFRIRNPDGLATAILRGDSSATYPYMLRIAHSTGGCFTAIQADDIRLARTLAAELEGLDICYSSAVALASAWRLAERGWIDPQEPVLVNLTGADRDSARVAEAVRYEDVA
jgi:threonine synthase